MPPEELFRGTTQAVRTLVLCYKHTAYDTFTDETGETFDNPAEAKVTATLDGAPISAEFRVSPQVMRTLARGELADYMIEDLRKAGWDIGEYE